MSYHRAQLNGTLTNDGGEASACGFEYGRTVAYGTTTPTESKVTGETFSQIILGLLDLTTYHFRAVGTNSGGIGYGADRSFTTSARGSYVCPYDGTVFTSWGELYIHLLNEHGVYICTIDGAIFSTWSDLYAHLASHRIVSAAVMTQVATNVTESTARVTGQVIEDLGVVSEIRFQWGLTTEYGVNTPWQDGYAKGDSFFADLKGLAEGQAFHFRTQIRNRGGVVSGNDRSFNTLSSLGPVTLVTDELINLLGAVA